MELKRIIVPNPPGDSMGASLRSLLEVLEQWSQLPKKVEIVIDLNNVNIVDHSGTVNGWIMVQHYPQKGYIDICITDTGTGILGSYQKAGNTEITNDSKALEYAINGKSTKQITETRGFGIDTSRRMLVEGLDGKYVLFSGKAIYIYTHELEQITPLQDFGWKGTLLALQVPVKAPVNFNYTTFLE